MILLDTHILLWLALEPRRLTRAAARALDDERLLCGISLREIAVLAKTGRMTFDEPVAEWLEDALSEHSVQVVPIDARIAARSVNVAQNFHQDPADQLIAATSIVLGVPLVTADEKLRASPALQTIW